MQNVCTSLEFKWNGGTQRTRYAIRARWALLLLAVCSDVYAKTMRFSHRNEQTTDGEMVAVWAREKASSIRDKCMNTEAFAVGIGNENDAAVWRYGAEYSKWSDFPYRKLQRHCNVHVSMRLHGHPNRIEIKVLNSISRVCAECDQESLTWTQSQE